jgi:Zn-finger nucleic acid-binding protein
MECPVCPGVRMAATRVGECSKVEIDHCTRCGGVWFEQGEVQQIRRHAPAAVWARITWRGGRFRMACRGCHERIERGAEACRACGWANVLDCPSCDRPMERARGLDLTLDICRACRGAWFDSDELDAIWRGQAAVALAAHPATAHLAGDREHAGNVLADALSTVDGIEAAYYVTRAGVEVASALPEASAGAFELSVSIVEAAGQASSAVFDVVCGVLELLFGLLDGL